MAKPLGDVFASIAALALLLAVLVSVDPRMRNQVALRLSSADARAQLNSAAAQLRGFTRVIVEAVRFQSAQHTSMVFLVLTGCVLVVFMLRM